MKWDGSGSTHSRLGSTIYRERRLRPVARGTREKNNAPVPLGSSETGNSQLGEVHGSTDVDIENAVRRLGDGRPVLGKIDVIAEEVGVLEDTGVGDGHVDGSGVLEARDELVPFCDVAVAVFDVGVGFGGWVDV